MERRCSPKRADRVTRTVHNCSGRYEEKLVIHTVRYQGNVVVIDHVPAEVGTVCGDVLFRPETVRQIEAVLRRSGPPARRVPRYEYMQTSA